MTNGAGGDEPTELEKTELDRTAPESPGALRGDPVQIGRFRLEERIGSGGMADVHRAYDPVLDRTVAIKVLHTESLVDEAQQRRRILREARAAAALTHPNTVVVYEVGEADGQVFIAMELLDGEPLRAALRRETPLEDRLRWLLEAARALEAAHTRGLVHRDVKPENMFVCRGGTLKLLDFGIAKRDDDEGGGGVAESALGPSSLRTAAGVRVGTPRYMAPEQKAGQPTDGRTDQYAWALVAFEVLTGSHTIATHSTVKIEAGAAVDEQEALASARLERLRAVEGVPEPVARAIVRALSERKEDRFESMTSIVTILEETLLPPSSPARDAPGETARTPSRSWRGAAAFAFVLAVAVGGGGAMAYRRWMRPATAPGTAERAPPRPTGPPPCTVGAVRSYPASLDDHITLAGDTLVVGRSAGNSGDSLTKTYEREDGGRLVPYMPLTGQNYVNLRGETNWLHGGAIAGKKAVVFHGSRLLLAAWLEGGSKMGRRFQRPIDLVTAAQFRDSMVLAITGAEVVFEGPATMERTIDNGWVGVLRLTSGLERLESTMNIGEHTTAPALAVTDERMGFAFTQARSSIRFVFVDERAQLTGDAMVVAKVDARPAVAFVGETPVVLWADPREAGRRLVTSTLAEGASAFGPAVVAVDEPLANYRPVTARLPTGAYAVLWVAAVGGRPTLRAATLRKGAALSVPVDLGTGTFHMLTTSTTATGFDVAWVDDGARTVRVASVTCAP